MLINWITTIHINNLSILQTYWKLCFTIMNVADTWYWVSDVNCVCPYSQPLHHRSAFPSLCQPRIKLHALIWRDQWVMKVLGNMCMPPLLQHFFQHSMTSKKPKQTMNGLLLFHNNRTSTSPKPLRNAAQDPIRHQSKTSDQSGLQMPALQMRESLTSCMTCWSPFELPAPSAGTSRALAVNALFYCKLRSKQGIVKSSVCA